MFLHSGASLHGHEYSSRPPSQHPPPINRRSPLLRAALATTPASRSNTPADGTRSRILPPHRRQVSENNSPRSLAEPVVRFQEPAAEVEPPKPEPMSEDEASYSASEASYLSDTTAAATSTPKLPRRRRSPRKSTTYLFAHPAPKLRSKKQLPIQIHIRPKLLLQLQQLSVDRRPRPVIDVFPSSLITGNVVAPRFSKKFPRLFGVKGELGVHDVILVRSEDYGSHSPDTDSDGEEDSLEHRQLLGVVSPLRREARAEIVLVDGSVWVAIPLVTGSYEFVHIDEHGNTTTARWVRRSVVKATSSGTPESASPAINGPASLPATGPEYKFTFSIIDPESRRHPIMGTLTKSTLEILDHYTTVSPSSGRYPPSKPFSRSATMPSTPTPANSTDVFSPPTSPSSQANQGRDPGILPPTPISPVRGRTTFPVDDTLKDLMSITAIWVLLRQGWATNYKPPAAAAAAAGEPSTTNPCQAVAASGLASVSTSVQSRVGSRRNRSSRNEESLPQPQLPSQTPELNRGRSSTGEPADVREGRLLTMRKRSTMPIESIDREHSPTPSLSALRTWGLPRRATSTGAAFMQRRMQAQMSDTSDSERGVIGRKSKGLRVLSGDFGPWARQSPALVGLADADDIQDGTTTTPTTSVRDDQVVASSTKPPTSPAATLTPGPTFSNGRRAVSAYYPSTPAMDMTGGGAPDADKSSDLVEMRGVGGSLTEDESMDVVGGKTIGRGNAGVGSSGAKWRRFSNWFKKLGAR